jgi:hypothetical protein
VILERVRANNSLTILKKEYQFNVETLKLEITDYESNIRDLDLKLDDAIVSRDKVERFNWVLSEERNVQCAEKDKLTELLAAKDAQIKQPTLQGKIWIPRKAHRNLVQDSDTDDDDYTTMVNKN